ncbi:MAG: methyl-accepting chemotaxis protein [SAR324 cluster bacterium]|nr:methyl-accepting chemotaxis protein [SAR324 cluster bacterium]
MKLKVWVKLSLSYLIPISIMIVIGFWSYNISKDILYKVVKAKENQNYALVVKDMTAQVIQIQQWLTDISATRGLDGLNDGFDEAQNNYDGFMVNLGKFEKLYQKIGNSEGLRELASLKMAVSAFYETGKVMAKAYIEQGPSGGNKIMGEFDTVSLDLQKLLVPFVDEQVKQSRTIADEIVDMVHEFVEQIEYLIALSIILTGGIGYLISRSIIRPLGGEPDDMAEITQKISMGNLNFVIDQKEAAHGLLCHLLSMSEVLHRRVMLARKISEGDLNLTVKLASEDDTLGKAFQKMIKDLNHLISQISNNAAVIELSSNKLQAFAGQMNYTAEETSNKASFISDASREMGKNIESVVTSTEEMSVNIGSISDSSVQMGQNVGSVRDTVKEMADAIGQVSVQANKALTVAQEASAMSESANGVMEALGISANEIGDVTSLIKVIAQQTNLLALNANIEAASAGEAGKGFAVVANEIKGLAKQSAGAAENIATKIQGIQEQTKSSIETINQMGAVTLEVTGASTEINEMVKAQITASTTIASSMDQTEAAVTEMSRMIGEMADVAKGVATDTSHIKVSSDQVLTSAGQIATSSMMTTAGIGGVKQSSEDLSGLAESLTGLIAHFKLKPAGLDKEKETATKEKA